MRAWAVAARVRSTAVRSCVVERPAARAGRRARSGSGSRSAACAAPTCISPRATCRRTAATSCRATRSSGRRRRLGAGRVAVRARRPGRHRLAAPHLRRAAGSAAAGDENLCVDAALHRLGRRRRLRRVRRRRRALRLPRSRTLRRREAAPLLCAGIIGYRALRRAAAARRRPARHLRLRRLGPPRRAGRDGRGRRPCTCMTRRRRPGGSRSTLGAASAGRHDDAPPEPLDAAILFAPAGEIVPGRAERARPGRHARHRRHPPHATSRRSTTQRHLFQERQLRSVTANTRPDGESSWTSPHASASASTPCRIRSTRRRRAARPGPRSRHRCGRDRHARARLTMGRVLSRPDPSVDRCRRRDGRNGRSSTSCRALRFRGR